MCKVHQLITLLSFLFTLAKCYNISTCIPNTSCKCYLTQHSFTFINCSHTLSDIPIFNAQNTVNITKIVARNALVQWPSQLCKYTNIQILDLSGSYFDPELVDFSCLTHLIHLNLSNTQLNKIPIFETNLSNHLQILDLSNNHIKIIDAARFHSLNNLISIFLQNNPIEFIEHLEDLFSLSHIESIHLISSNLDVTLKQSLTINQWIDIANKWNDSTKPFIIRMNNIPLQSIIPKPNQFQMITINSVRTILQTLINSTFITLFNTPKCHCADLQSYQRYFSFVDYRKKYSSALFQSVTCLMPDSVTHARLFDRRTYIDLRCPLVGKIAFFPSLRSSSSSLNKTLIFFFIFSFFLFY